MRHRSALSHKVLGHTIVQVVDHNGHWTGVYCCSHRRCFWSETAHAHPRQTIKPTITQCEFDRKMGNEHHHE